MGKRLIITVFYSSKSILNTFLEEENEIEPRTAGLSIDSNTVYTGILQVQGAPQNFGFSHPDRGLTCDYFSPKMILTQNLFYLMICYA